MHLQLSYSVNPSKAMELGAKERKFANSVRARSRRKYGIVFHSNETALCYSHSVGKKF